MGRVAGLFMMRRSGRGRPGRRVDLTSDYDRGYFFLDPALPPLRDPARRRPELLATPFFFAPVPDAPGRFLLFRAPVEPRPDVCPFFPPGAAGFDPRPFPPACDVRDGPLVRS